MRKSLLVKVGREDFLGRVNSLCKGFVIGLGEVGRFGCGVRGGCRDW